MDVRSRLRVLANASRYDLACACGTKDARDHRRRAEDGTWLYPVAQPSGGVSIMLKTLMTNACSNDCLYCPLRAGRDVRRFALKPHELARVHMQLVRRGRVMGLFLSSGVLGGPDPTMERMVETARILRRRHDYDGFIHLKVIPGASDAAVDAALDVADAVSLNIEAPTRSAFASLSKSKDFDRDIVAPLRRICRLTGRGNRHERVGTTTQFIVGAGDETDREIVTATGHLYRRLGLRRTYFSAYQRGLGDKGLPGEQRTPEQADALLTREHRLYQAEWLLRKYGFEAGEIPFGPDGNLSLDVDPKESWARRHPEFFPLNVNQAAERDLLRVPGLGPTTVRRIITARHRGARLRRLDDLGRPTKRLRKASEFIEFGAALTGVSHRSRESHSPYGELNGLPALS